MSYIRPTEVAVNYSVNYCISQLLLQICYVTNHLKTQWLKTSLHIFLSTRHYLVHVSSARVFILLGLAATWDCPSHGGSQNLKRTNQAPHVHLKPLIVSRLSPSSTVHNKAHSQSQSGSRKLYPTSGGRGGGVNICWKMF